MNYGIFFNEFLSEKEPLEIAGLITDDFCVYDVFFWFDGYGKIHSGDISAVLKTFDDIDWHECNTAVVPSPAMWKVKSKMDEEDDDDE